MKSSNWKMVVVTLIIANLSQIVMPSNHQKTNCSKFSSIMSKAKLLVESQSAYNLFLERIGFVQRSNIFAADSSTKCIDGQVKNTKILTIAAQIYKSEYDICSENFESLAQECMKEKTFFNHKMTNVHPKYRTIDGRGNNVKYPEWGASDAPFSHYGPKNYEDGIYKIKKSVTGSDLPNARELVQNVLLKAVQSPPPPIIYNVLSLLIILFATHDLHYQIPMQTNCENTSRFTEIRCCSKDNHDTLPPDLSNSACLPIEVSKNDPFYKNGKIGCINVVRSQLGKFTHGVETGEILNGATSYLDLSLIYGNHESELKPLRLYKGGKLRMGKNNVLPVDSNGKYLPSMNRFILTPVASVLPSLFSRNHNHLAIRLAKLNPHWDDETTFQEARRINIANFQYNLITTKTIEKIFNKVVNASYSVGTNAATSVEFSFAYRSGHYYTPTHVLFQNENFTETKYLQSDTIGKIELLENSFDDALRGAISQPVNVDQFTDEMINRIGKNSDGFGVDLVATDIQRGRDHGLPSFVEIRRKCKLSPEINSFDDFNKIFNRTNVDLLKSMYNSHEDVDFYLGGLLETFETIANPYVGPTFGCVVGENYKNTMGGDIYFYSHPENPYPFTKAQIDSISKYPIPNILCTNSGLKEINKLWPYASTPKNPKADCKNYPQMDLSPWKE